MDSTLQLTGTTHETALRKHLAQWNEASVFPLGILSDHGLGVADDSPLKAYGLWDDDSSDSSANAPQGHVFPRLKSAVLVGGSGGFVLPFATSLLDAQALGVALKGIVAPQSILGPKRICDGFLKGIGSMEPTHVTPLDLYGASPDFLGPFVCPELRRATASDMPKLVPFSAQAVEEMSGMNPLTTSREAFERRLLARVVAGRTFVLMRNGELILKLDIAVAGIAGAEIDGLHVKPEARRQGLATLCLGQLTRYLLGRMPSLTLKIPSNDDRAAQLCKRVGYLSVRKSDEMRLMILR